MLANTEMMTIIRVSHGCFKSAGFGKIGAAPYRAVPAVSTAYRHEGRRVGAAPHGAVPAV